MSALEYRFDLLIIGAGVIGSAAARELSRYRLSIAVLEQNPDLFGGTSARNSGVLHAGFNNTPGTKMARLCVEGNRTFAQAAAELDVPFRRTGKLVVGFTAEDRAQLLRLQDTGRRNGVPDLHMIDRERMRALAPAVEGNFALYSGSTGIFSPFQWNLGLAENAACNGVSFFFSHRVSAIGQREGLWQIQAGNDTFYSRWVVNAAGLFSDRISTMLGIPGYQIHPCRGEYFLLDPRLSPLLPLPAYPVPNYHTGGLGIHLTPTVDGNIMIGPSTEYIDGREDWATTASIQSLLLAEGRRIFPSLHHSDCIRSFAGVRPKLSGPDKGGYLDFVIERRDDLAPRAVNLVGIESPGLTAALPIAREVVRLVEEVEQLEFRSDFTPIRRRFPTFRDKTPEQQAAMIRENPDYGEILCRCETITRAEALAALEGPLGAKTLTGLKYRCRAMMGRCQGGYCQMRLAELLMERTGQRPEALLYSREGSWLFTGKVREQDANG